jgi:hypothetical protein
MTTVPIQEQRHMPTTTMPMHVMQKCLKVFRALTQSYLKQAVAGKEIHCTKHYSLGIPATQQHLRRLAALRPRHPQRWKQQQIRLILDQQRTAPWQATDGAANLAFFSLARNPAPAHIVHASKYSRAGVAFDARSVLNSVPRGHAKAVPAAAALSIAWRSSHDVAACPSTGSATDSRHLHSSLQVVQNGAHQQVSTHRAYAGNSRPSCRHSDDSPEASRQFLLPACRNQPPVRQACVGITGNRACVAEASPVVAAHWLLIFCCP